MKQSLSSTLQRFNASTLQRLPIKSRQVLLVLIFALMLGGHTRSFAHPCNPLANFTFTTTGCDVAFQPVANGPGMAHFWTFKTTILGFTSASNIPTPIHTFGAATPGIRTVTHSVTIGGVMYTCSKEIDVPCERGCDDRAFS